MYNKFLEVGINSDSDHKHADSKIPMLMIACKHLNKRQVDIFDNDGEHHEHQRFVYYTDNN